MSTYNLANEALCSRAESCDAIELVLKPQPRDIGGFSVNRCLPSKEKRSIGPWIFFDEMGPTVFSPGLGINVRPHPHVNLATVTYLFEGEILHRDSIGTVQKITPGDINLMVAGKGIVHSERESAEMISKVRGLHGLQLWLALPESQEEVEPAFFHYAAADIPTTVVNNVPIRVMIGTAYGLVSPVQQYYKTLYLEAHLLAGQTLELPNAPERGVYIATGELKIKDGYFSEKQMVVLHAADKVTVKAITPTTIALIGGEKINRRFMEWNFASSRKDRIDQAKTDWVHHRFPIVPGDEEEFIPLPGANL